MKTPLKFLSIGLSVAVLGMVEAKSQIWDASFVGTELLYPPWSVNGVAYDDGNSVVLEPGAYVDVSTSPWTPSDTDFTVEFALSILSQGSDPFAQTLYIYSPAGFWGVQVSTNNVRLEGLPGVFTDVSVDATQSTVYRIVVNDGLANLYINDAATPAVNVQPYPFYDLTVLSYGDRGSGTDGSGRWEYLQWNNTQALAPIPEPSSLALCGIMVLGTGLYLRRKALNKRRSC